MRNNQRIKVTLSGASEGGYLDAISSKNGDYCQSANVQLFCKQESNE
jgi:hypothetical protein